MVGARLYERRDFEEAVRLIATGVVPADRLISAVVPLDEAGEAFASLEGGGAMKVLVDCTESEEVSRAV
jgi:threonine dehydrogenase-like Zn-dependent dehydrogenase